MIILFQSVHISMGTRMLIMDMDVNIKHKKKSKMDRENATVGHVHVVILQTKKVYRKMILPGKVESRKRGVWKKIHTSFCPNK